jgi:CheY-like chemotaxis protein
MMGGDIEVSSVLGEGSEFTATLLVPRSEAPSQAPPVALPSAEAPTGSVGAQAAVACGAPRILVVEDHPINQKLVGVLLSRMGLHVTFCENGQLALDRVAAESFDVILMDVNMPVMDGLTATRAIRAMSGAVARTPIVVFTADVMNEATEMARDAGADDFLGKPVKLEQLRATICKYLEGFEPKNS